MEKAAHAQLELFATSPQAEGSRSSPAHPFFGRLWRFERTILIVIGLLVTAVIAFSMGVERGRRTTLSMTEVPVTQVESVAPKTAPASQTQRAPAAKPQVQQESSGPTLRAQATQKQVFTIQIATFSTKTLAQREAEEIKKKGHTPKLLSSNGYTVLCVGNFSSRETAKTALTELKKYYKDCFVRRL